MVHTIINGCESRCEMTLIMPLEIRELATPLTFVILAPEHMYYNSREREEKKNHRVARKSMAFRGLSDDVNAQNSQ